MYKQSWLLAYQLSAMNFYLDPREEFCLNGNNEDVMVTFQLQSVNIDIKFKCHGLQ